MNVDSPIFNGWLNIFKEQGYTSSHVVRTIKKTFNIKKIGHYGTLDPLASGVLPLALGEATKTIQFITFDLKSYSFFINWGKETDTCDKEGKVLRETEARPNIVEIKPTIKSFGVFNTLLKSSSFNPRPKPNIINAKIIGAILVTTSKVLTS